MTAPPAARLLTGLVGALGLATALGVALWRQAEVAWSSLAATGPGHPADAISLVAATAALLLLGWLALAVILEALALAPGVAGRAARSAAGRFAPGTVRQLLSVVLGVAVAAGLAPVAPSSAATVNAVVSAREPSPRSAMAGVRDAVDVAPDPSLRALAARLGGGTDAAAATAPVTRAGPVPMSGRPGRAVLPRPAQPPVDLVTSRPAGPGAAAEDIVVRRGDTLWGIAAHFLGPGASDAEVAREWPRWHAANRSVIGEDPDLIHPGTRLRHPTAALPRSERP